MRESLLGISKQPSFWKIHQDCHPDRSATEILVPPEIYGAEWRDPEICP